MPENRHSHPVSHRPARTVVWAIEAFSPTSYEAQLRMAAALRWLLPSSNIVPVYILSDESFASRGFSRFLRSALKPAASQALRRFFAKIPGLEIRGPRILIEASSSQDECAHKLVRFADKIHADFIAIGSHGKSILARWLGRSFSEAVMRFSQVPVLIVGPKSETCARPPKAVVLMGDFSAAPNDSFAEILNYVVDFEAELHLFHKTSNDLNSLKQMSPLSLIDTFLASHTAFHALHAFHGNDRRGPRQTIQQWIDAAHAKGVKTRIVDENFREPTSKAIVHYLHRLGEASNLVAMVRQKNRGAFLESITRDVIRRSPCPVYITPAAR